MGLLVQVFKEKCTAFRVDVFAVDFARCKCGRLKNRHDPAALRQVPLP